MELETESLTPPRFGRELMLEEEEEQTAAAAAAALLLLLLAWFGQQGPLELVVRRFTATLVFWTTPSRLMRLPASTTVWVEAVVPVTTGGTRRAAFTVARTGFPPAAAAAAAATAAAVVVVVLLAVLETAESDALVELFCCC